MSRAEIHPLRVMRHRLNLTQKQLAEKTGIGTQTILRAEHNKPINAGSRQLLCQYFGVTSEELGLVTEESPHKEQAPPPREQPAERLTTLSQAIAQGIVLAAQELESPHMGKSRRNFLHMLGLTSTALVTPSPTLVVPAQGNSSPPLWQRLSRALERPTCIEEMMLLQLEANARSCWKLIPDVLGTFSHDLLHYVQEQLAAVTTVLESSPPPDIRVRLASIAGELAQIIGEILFDLKENYQAEQYYNVAIEAAKIAQNDVMQAVALGRKCFIPIYNHDAGRGLPYIERARALTKENAPNLTRAWLAAVEAEILANMAEEKRCRKALDNCESALKHAQPGESSYARFSYPTLLGYKGICYIRLKQLHVAEKVLCEALTIIEPDRIRHKSIILVDLARTYMQQGEIEEACQYASQALVIILQVKSARVFQRVLNFRHMLQPWQRTMVVKHLDEEIASVYPFVAHTRA